MATYRVSVSAEDEITVDIVGAGPQGAPGTGDLTRVEADMRYFMINDIAVNPLRDNSTDLLSIAISGTNYNILDEQFIANTITIAGNSTARGVNSNTEANGEYVLQANTVKYIGGFNDTVTQATTAGPFFWYNSALDISLVATDAESNDENWRLVRGNWETNPAFDVGDVIVSPGIGQPAPVGGYVIGTNLFFGIGRALQEPSGVILAAAGSGDATFGRRFEPNFIGRQFADRTVPTSSSSAGEPGQIAIDGTYLYFHNGTQWLRVTGSTF